MKLAVHINTHSGHRRFLKPCLECCKKLDPTIIVCSYNTTFNISLKHTTNRVMPEYDTMCLADRWIIGDYGANVSSWLWLHKYGIATIVQGTKQNEIPDYVFGFQGDCFMLNPEGVFTLISMMEKENADIICAEHKPPNYASVISYLATTSAIAAIIDLMVATAYDARNPEGVAYGNMEGRMGKAIANLDLKCIPVRNPSTAHFSFGDRGTWGDILGFYHSHGTEKWRIGNHHKPLPKYFYDTRYVYGRELGCLNYYWETGDIYKLESMGNWRPATDESIQNGKIYADEI